MNPLRKIDLEAWKGLVDTQAYRRTDKPSLRGRLGTVAVLAHCCRETTGMRDHLSCERTA